LGLGTPVILLTAACSLFFENPSIRVIGVRVTSLGLTAGTAEVGLKVFNPNRYQLQVQKLVYRLDVERSVEEEAWAELAADSTSERVSVAARDSAQVSLTVPFQYRALGTALVALLQEGEVRYRLRGAVQVRGPLGSFQVPFESRDRLQP
jgi:LEA14-like dessication related protein